MATVIFAEMSKMMDRELFNGNWYTRSSLCMVDWMQYIQCYSGVFDREDTPAYTW